MPVPSASTFRVPLSLLGVSGARGGEVVVEVRAFATVASAAVALWAPPLANADLCFVGEGWRAYELPCGGARAVAGRLVITVSSGTDDGRDREAVRQTQRELIDAIVELHERRVA
jgi:hypothetical protein